MKVKILRILLLLIFPSVLGLKSCRKKCADNSATFPDYNCIQLIYDYSAKPNKIYTPTISELESNIILKASVIENSITPHANFIGDYLPFDFNHSVNTFVFNDSSKIDTIIISGLNAKAIYTQGDCGFQMKVNQPTINKNTFKNRAKCEVGSWNSTTQTITLKITF